MKTYDYIVIGFGKAGKTFAKTVAKKGHKVAVIEAKQEMYGGTCINVGCIPTKTLVHDSLQQAPFQRAIERKKLVVSKLNQKNYSNLETEENIDIYTHTAQFKSDKVVALMDNNTEIDTLTADKIIINTGAKTIIPEVKGIETSKRLYDSTGIMNITTQPKHLIIIGGGYIALEFASMFANFGTKVTILERNEDIMKREDSDIVSEVKKVMQDKNIRFQFNTEVQTIEDQEETTIITTNNGKYEGDAVLLAVGRIPNTSELGLENTAIQVGEHGEIVVNEKLETPVPGIYVAGDVKGGLQFTYISLDDHRILMSQLFGDKTRTTENRGTIPYTVFIDPPLSRVGMTLKEAKEKYNAVDNTIMVNTIPRHLINNDPRGMFNVVVDQDTHQILGATLFGLQSEEMINLIKFAIDHKIKYDALRDGIYTHPTMTESFNDLFNI